jgi:YHS domain-containing protein
MEKFFFIVFVLSVYSIHAQSTQPDTLKYCVDEGAVGAGGFDLVSYFNVHMAKKGSPEFRTKYDGVTYWFASAENLGTFLSMPSTFLPQFGGWCSMTLAMGRATKPTFDNFLVSSGKLYFFERTLSVNGKELWLTNPQNNEVLASKNYQRLIMSGKVK